MFTDKKCKKNCFQVKLLGVNFKMESSNSMD